MSKYKVSIFGNGGMVGGSLKRYFEKKDNYEVYGYDKKGLGSLEELNKADFIYVCLPTPYNPDTGCDISIIKNGIKEIRGNKVIIIKSTVIPGTTQLLQNEFPQHKFLFNPEFLTEETCDQDMAFPDRQILGYTKESYTIAKDVMQQLPLAPYERIVPARVAEMIKYFGNNWFSAKVVFANQMYDLCQRLGIDYEEVKSGAAADKRIGRTHLDIWHKGGRGAGGKCLRKDLRAMIHFAQKNNVSVDLLEKVDEINEYLLNNYGKEKIV